MISYVSVESFFKQLDVIVLLVEVALSYFEVCI